mgnify:CR=1 FL=1|jgi:hypothetical protein|nr:MAG TPA: hypothetical protein [Caudoviricetes sp.]
MQLFQLKDYLKSWSTWVLGAVTVVPVLDANVQAIADLLPANWKPYFITTLGVVGLVVRAIKQRG